MNEPIKPAPCFAITRCVLGRVTIRKRAPLLGGPRGRAMLFGSDGRYTCRYFRPGDWS
jgi:hypothetical protein